jgi:glycerol-3-phosphate dehydrogenase
VYDLIVIGGGITGAGIAQDAASRGLKTILVEKGDFASGTSSKSTKLIHGGLRYLENLQFKVVLESVRERQLQQQIAPHLVWSLPFVIPTYSGKRLKSLKLRLGLSLYDLMAVGFDNLKRHHSVSRAEVLRLCPGIDQRGLTGGIVYYDCRTDDARHTLEVLKSACEHGALAFNYTRVTGLVRNGGRIAGIEVVDELADRRGERPLRIMGRAVVNATGVWTRRVTDLAGGHSNTEVVPAKGIHITLSPDRLPLKSAIIVPSVHDKRFCFAIPWYDSIVVGTTDTEYHGDLDRIAVEPEEIRYLLEAVNAQFPGARLTDADITGTYAGLRPLIKDTRSTATADISREHRLDVSEEGLVSISGGKLTTYRRMASQVVDHVVSRCLAPEVRRRTGASITDRLMLGGWEAGDDVSGVTAVYRQMALDLGLAPDTAAYLPTVYGRRVRDLLLLVKGDPALARKLSPVHPQILAQVLYGIWAEGARTVEDVLARRMRLAITDRRAAAAACQSVADLMAEELGWGEDLKSSQVQRFLKEWL